MSKITPEEAALKRNFLKQRQSLPLKLKLNFQNVELESFTNILTVKYMFHFQVVKIVRCFYIL